VNMSQKGHTMIYEVEGRTKNISLALLDKVLCFAQDYLGIKETAVLTIKFSRGLDEHVCGYCDEVDIDEDWVEVELNTTLKRESMIATIFHEMVHVQQILTKRLVQGSPSTWNGIEYGNDYSELPWEIEAYDLEEKMVREFNPNV